MDHTVFTWDELCRNAENLYLDQGEFRKLESFFKEVSPLFFRECAGRTLLDFPMETVKSTYRGKDFCRFLLLCIVANYGNLAALYREKQYHSRMLDEISHDLRVWEDTLFRDLDGYGLTERIFLWERDCLTGVIKQFGRLQAETMQIFLPQLSVYRKNGSLEILPALRPGNPPMPDLSVNDKIVNLHIPASGSLAKPLCLNSFYRIRTFMSEFCPDYEWKAFVCCSWMLDPQFRTFLKPESNVVQFQKLGHLFTLDLDATDETIWRLWGEQGRNTAVEKLPVRTSMERGVVDFLQKGGSFKEGCLVIFRDELDELLRGVTDFPDKTCR